MKIFILAIGTRGDIETFLTLSRVLARRGHQVTFGTSPYFGAKVTANGFNHVPIGLGNESEASALLRSTQPTRVDGRRLPLFFDEWVDRQIIESSDAIRSMAGTSDYFVSNVRMRFWEGERLIPGALVTTWLPYSLHDLDEHGSDRCAGQLIELVALSGSLIDFHHDWDKRHQFTGFWLDDRQPSAHEVDSLYQYLASGPPPVAVVLGYTTHAIAQAEVSRILAAVSQAGQRAIIVGRLPEQFLPPQHVLTVSDDLPLPWLFRHCAAVVHDGNAHVTGAALSSGKVSVVLPIKNSQHRLGTILQSEGLATGVFPIDDIPIDQLEAAIRAACADPSRRQRAVAWKAQIEGERGVAVAADYIEKHMHWLRCQHAAS